MSHTRKRGSTAKVTYFPEGCIIIFVTLTHVIIVICNTILMFTEESQGNPPIKVKFEIPYFTVSGIQVSIVSFHYISRIIILLFYNEPR
jgi:hypothetical protein